MKIYVIFEVGANKLFSATVRLDIESLLGYSLSSQLSVCKLVLDLLILNYHIFRVNLKIKVKLIQNSIDYI